jgi:hypothetical protein
MTPEEEIAYLQQQHDRMAKDLEIARESEDRQQATAQLLEAKIAQCDLMVKEAQAMKDELARQDLELQGRMADEQMRQDAELQEQQFAEAQRQLEVQTREADETQRSVTDKAIETAKDVVLGVVDYVKGGGLGEDQVTNSLGSQVLENMTDMVQGRADLYAKEAIGELGDQTMADMFPDATRDLEHMAEQHVEAQQKLERDLEALKEKFISDHADASAEQRAAQQAALEEQARAAREALERQQAAELQRMMERQQAPPVRY